MQLDDSDDNRQSTHTSDFGIWPEVIGALLAFVVIWYMFAYSL